MVTPGDTAGHSHLESRAREGRIARFKDQPRYVTRPTYRGRPKEPPGGHVRDDSSVSYEFERFLTPANFR